MRYMIMICATSLALSSACNPEHSGADASDSPTYDAGGSDAATLDASAGDARLPDVFAADLAAPDSAARDAGAPPPAWTCPPDWWGDDDCDCGCGALDLDCTGPTTDACTFDMCDVGTHAVAEENWRCEPDAVTLDGGAPDTAMPDTAMPDTAAVDAGLPRGTSCAVLGAGECTPGLVCAPSGTCQEPCAEEHCANNASYCFSTWPDYVCDDPAFPYCVEGEGSLKLCRDVNIDFTEQFCVEPGSYVIHYHTDYTIPDGCWGGPLVFVGSRICISATEDSSLTALGGDLTVITDDPSSYTDESSCDYYSFVELNALEVVGGNLEVGEVSSYTERSPMKVDFEAIELPVLEAVYGQLRYDAALSVTHINFPELALVGGWMVLSDLPAMETVYLPGLEVIEGSLRLDNLPALTTLELGALRRIDGYVYVRGVPCVERAALDRLAALATGPVSIDSASGSGAGCP